MNKKIFQFLLIISFVIAQFFTQQLHELTHFLSHTNWQEDYTSHHHSGDNASFANVDEHPVCKFLQYLASQPANPYLTTGISSVAVAAPHVQLHQNTLQFWLSFSASSFHQARAPPQV